MEAQQRKKGEAQEAAGGETRAEREGRGPEEGRKKRKEEDARRKKEERRRKKKKEKKREGRRKSSGKKKEEKAGDRTVSRSKEGTALGRRRQCLPATERKGKEEKEEEDKLGRRPERKEGAEPGSRRWRHPSGRRRAKPGSCGRRPERRKEGRCPTTCGLEARVKEMEEERGEEIEENEGKGGGRQSNHQPTQGGPFPRSEQRGSASKPTGGVGEEGEPRRCEEESVEPAGPLGPSETRRWSGIRAEKEMP